jgi:hypothetical protein
MIGLRHHRVLRRTSSYFILMHASGLSLLLFVSGRALQFSKSVNISFESGYADS